MVLDGVEWKSAIARHQNEPDEAFIRKTLGIYQQNGYTYLRDGGDRWGVGYAAQKLGDEYGITYRTPGAPLCQKGCYGSFIGQTYENLTEYKDLVLQAKKQGADFIKIMISGLMDFDRYGVLTQEGLPKEQIHSLIHIAHEEGFAVMAHCNGGNTALYAAEAGVDSIEHGAYLHKEALDAMAEQNVIWVPTLSTIGNLRGKGRFQEDAVQAILKDALENVSYFGKIGGSVACGTDAGAWAVPHGSETERPLLYQAGLTDEAIDQANARIRQRFCRK